MANTVISLETSLDVVDKYKELIKASTDGDSLYIKAKETATKLYDDSEMTDEKKAELIGTTIANMATSLASSSMSTALNWSIKEKELVLQKEELEYKIDLIKFETDKAEQDAIISQANKHLIQARILREYGVATINSNDDLVALNDSGKVYEEIRALQQDTANKALLPEQIQSQTEEVQARTHKLVADTYVNHGLYTGYTITNTGISSATKVSTGYVTLSDMNKQVAKEQAKGYAWNAWSNAASSSGGMIGTLIAAEIPDLDPTIYLNTWQSAVASLNSVTEPNISI